MAWTVPSYFESKHAFSNFSGVKNLFTLSSDLTCKIDRRENRGTSLLTVQYPCYSFPKRKHSALDLVFDLSCNFHTDYPPKTAFLTANPTHGFCEVPSKITFDHRHVEISRPAEYSTALEYSQHQLSPKKNHSEH